ncbi:MAG: tape measure protein [Lachnospiraceae bacterium]|nr:tape measure protein [Lachnospiraceae bacterium]
MGYDGSLKFDTSINESGFNSGVKKLGSLAKGGLNVLAGAVAGVATAMGAATAVGIKYNASIESYQTSFEVMTGSADKAAEVIERLKKVGAETPFELPELADTTQLLMNYGFTADEAMDSMMMLGDISQGSADKMSRIAMAYGQMSSAGKVSLEDVKQMIEAGFNPLQEISESTGESMSSLYDRISKGTISVDEITASMQRATSEGGKYYQSMEKQSQTINGLISTLKDSAMQLLGEVVKPITESFGQELLPAAISAIEQLTTAFKENGTDGLIAAGGQIVSNLLLGIAEALPGIIGTAISVIQSLVDNINLNLPQILVAGGQILMALANGIIQLLPSLIGLALNIITTLVSGLVMNLPQLLAQANQMFSDFCLQIQNRLPELIQRGTEMIISLLTGLLNNAPQIIEQVSQMMMNYLDTICGMLPDILQSGADIILNLLSGLISNAPQIITQAGKMLTDYIATIGSHLPEILQKGIEIIGQLLAGIIREVPTLIAAIPGIIADLGSTFLDKDWGEIGLNIIEGVASGIANAAGNLVDAAVSAAEDAVEAVKGWLGIHSPSRKMRDEVGKMMALGMGIGFEKNVPTNEMTSEMVDSVRQMQRKVYRITSDPINMSGSTVPVQSRNTQYEKSADFDYERMGKETAKAIGGMGVYMDSKPVGKLVASTVNDELGKLERRKT